MFLTSDILICVMILIAGTGFIIGYLFNFYLTYRRAVSIMNLVFPIEEDNNNEEE